FRSERQRELLAGEVAIARTYDADHVRAIHRHLFQDVYEWAGQYRTVNMAKGVGRGFADVATGEIDRYLADVQRLVRGTEWSRLEREEFGERAATVFAYLNQAHPFREGNGRTAKVFMEHVAQQSRFTLHYERVPPEIWNLASMLSRPDMFAYEPEPASLVPVFRHIAVERTRTSRPGVDPAGRQRSPRAASYPQSPTAAGQGPGRRAEPQPYRPGRGYGSNRPGRGYGTSGRGGGRRATPWATRGGPGPTRTRRRRRPSCARPARCGCSLIVASRAGSRTARSGWPAWTIYVRVTPWWCAGWIGSRAARRWRSRPSTSCTSVG